MNKIVRRIMAFTLGIGALLTASACENFLGSASESIDSQSPRRNGLRLRKSIISP